ncbi:hypothetical protein [Streptosporangium longisporum]|uniref:HK97 gp10 family phage protein n=1 Tax=Streptosporangium longisporum TaxID=46187 RepID=A0ABP6L434_9ACTN
MLFRFDWNEREADDLLRSQDGPVGRNLARDAETVARGMRRRAPVSRDGSHGRPPGYMRSKIGWSMHRDELGLYADIGTTARTPDGDPYPLYVEYGTRPHTIRPKKPGGTLHWVGADGTHHFAQEVHHPGTRAQPFIRPALDDLRRG